MFKKRLSALVVLFALCLTPLMAQQQENKSIIVILDCSKSISEKDPALLTSIGEIINSKIIDERVKEGDLFELYTFGERVELVAGGIVSQDKVKEPWKATISKLEADQEATDFGSAMFTVNERLQGLRLKKFSGSEPLVILISDGNISGINNGKCKAEYKTVDGIFNDTLLGETAFDLGLYKNWWFFGFQTNEPMTHLEEIASRTGNADHFMVVKPEELGDLEAKLDAWISTIPMIPNKIEHADIKMTSVSMGGKELLKDKSLKFSNTAKELELSFKSEYKENDVFLVFENMKAIVTSDSGEKKEVLLNIGADAQGRNLLKKVSAAEDTEVTFSFSMPEGTELPCGECVIKFDGNATAFGNKYAFIESGYKVLLKTPGQLAFEALLIPIIIVLALIIIVVIVLIVKSRAPVKVYMDLQGSGKSKPVSAAIGKKLLFGAKAVAKFKMDSNLFADSVGNLVRTGSKTWKIEPASEEYFDGNDKKSLDNYKLGSSVKVTRKDGSQTTLKFKKK